MKFFTWKDVERYILMHRSEWEKDIYNIEIYPDEMVVYPKNAADEESRNILRHIFKKNMEADYYAIKLDYPNSYITISYENEYMAFSSSHAPLFKKAIYQDSVYPTEKLNGLSCPVIAFHSYKGGVGRTLSLIAFAKAWTNIYKDPQKNKLLIVDSDLEAPGLTLIQENLNEESFSYLDLLTLVQDNNNIDEIVSKTVNFMGMSVLPIETKQQKVEHFFLPTYRYIEQLYDLYASPQTITVSCNKEYILAEVLSKLAEAIGAKAVLVDLRAGVSEYSAPLLLDPRVKKYCVTSTSRQSIMGTKQILQFISKGLCVQSETLLPTIFLSMIPDSFSEREKTELRTTLTECFQSKTTERTEELLDNMVVELPFASEVVHLTSFQQILSSLNGRDMYYSIEKIVEQYYQADESKAILYPEEMHEILLKKIHDFAINQTTAEKNGAAELLLTEPIKNLCLRYRNQVPITVVQGAKGSGKTFLYCRLLEKKNWNIFCSEINKKFDSEDNGYFLPVLATQNSEEIKPLLSQCIDEFNRAIDFADASVAVYIDNAYKLSLEKDNDIDWMKFWEQIFVSSVNKNMTSLSELDEALKINKKKIVLLIDGLEEILQSVPSSKTQQKAIAVLCQGVLNTISAKYENIGLIIFLRSDMAQNAITVNYEQFKQTFSYAELKWSSNEALKLAVWMVDHAVKGFYEESVSIENASQEVIGKYLEKIWGLKLGKSNSNEAYASNWILAALSDFNGQLQARDIIRFLEFASISNGKKPPYYDRIWMPSEVRNALPNCSRKKISEIKAEYENLKPIFEKLENLSSSKKKLPMNAEDGIMTAMEEKLMIQAGYLIRDGEKMYLPEIIRHALGFRYEKGARPRVLSLLLKH